MVGRYISCVIVVSMVLFSLTFAYLFDVVLVVDVPLDACIETVDPFCPQYEFSDSMLVSMAEVVEADLEESMPDYDFEMWVENGCIHSCRYLR